MIERPAFIKSAEDLAIWGKAVDGNYARMIRNPNDVLALKQNCYVDFSRAEFVKRWIETFCVLRTGEPFILQPWQYTDVIEPLFAWRKPNGKRRFSRAWIEVVKKQGKSLLCAALSIFFLYNAKNAPGIYCCASDRDQTDNVFKESQAMVEANEELSSVMSVNASRHRIACLDNGGIYQALSREAKKSEGKNVEVTIVDEIWCHHDSSLFDAMIYAARARTITGDPLMIVITHAGNDLEHFSYELHDQALQVLSGDYPCTDWFVYINGIRKGEEWKDEKIWRRCNPMLGVTIDESVFLSEGREAARFGGQKAQIFRQKSLNEWIGAAENPWLSLDDWDACPPLAELESFKGRPCVAAMDLASWKDLTCCLFLFREEDGTFSAVPRIWVPEWVIADRAMRSLGMFKSWEERGFIKATPGKAMDYDLIRAEMNELASTYLIEELAIDAQWQGAQLTMQLAKDGFNIHPFGKGWGVWAPAAQETEKLVYTHRIRHGGNPVFRWCVGNAVPKFGDYGDARPDKKKSKDKIDLVVCLAMACGVMLRRSGESSNYAGIYEPKPLPDVPHVPPPPGRWRSIYEPIPAGQKS